MNSWQYVPMKFIPMQQEEILSMSMVHIADVSEHVELPVPFLLKMYGSSAHVDVTPGLVYVPYAWACRMFPRIFHEKSVGTR